MRTWTEKKYIYAGKFGEGLKIVGYKIIQFMELNDHTLIDEREIKRVIY